MPSNPKRCKSLRGVFMNSGDIVLHHFATFETRLWPTKMPTRIAYSHSRICDLVRSRKVRCSSLIAKEHGVSARVANKLWKHVKTAFWSAVAANLPTCGPGEPIAESGYLQLSGSTAGELARRKRTKDICYMMLLGCGLKKIWIKRGSAIEIIWAWNIMEPKLICDDFHEIFICGSRLAHHDETTQNAGVEHYVNFI